ncbi:MAG TPA: M66 family metalloprotease [Chitinophagales bacterium]|nr:M66 family metalloprotease [Chitinophagales bacterium]HMY22739.1 M66 family metalloprotease [Chitinophagales bacterium]HNA37984.1 M66 family metalloprotease [Chitinophagales bacterium]HNB47878.1 M66 family metalloprotease [Chitinophagales bacterium]HNC71432.1 M66 family metalloprotease [Chitinophagales bacterium]
MGTIELDSSAKVIIISSAIICYGQSATYELSQHIADEISTMWNEANGKVVLNENMFSVRFNITFQYNNWIRANSILQNTNPRNNYIRIEEFSQLNISFVDAIGSNTGYFMLDNLYSGSTTCAHEYGHSLGLPHPTELNIIGKGAPGIMYPRGTLVDSEFQYDTNAQPGGPGGTLHPKYRKVKQDDIDNLQIAELIVKDIFVLGKFTNKYHEAHVKQDV